VAVLLFLGGMGAILAAPRDWVVGSARADIGQQFLAWRSFASASLRSGHWPFWNPYTYGGEPFLGGFQSALFYPLNGLFLFMPVVPAIHLSLWIHLFILGWGLRRWALVRGLHPAAAGIAGLILPLSGAVFPHLYAGHLANLCTLAWTPWILCGLEAFGSSGSLAWLLVPAAAAAFQILAGHPQYFYYTAVAAAVQAFAAWAGARLFPRRPGNARMSAPNEPSIPGARTAAAPGGAALVAGLTAVYAAASVLAAAQLVPGWRATEEGLRHAGLDARFAAQFSLPPENLLTLLAPGFFGGPLTVYWGRGYSWEMSCFIGVTELLLVAVALGDPERRRSAALDVIVGVVLMILALGSHTLLFRPLFACIPGFAFFRGWSKFSFPATVFLILAAAGGADSLLRRRPCSRSLLLASAAGGCGLAAAGAALLNHPALVAAWIESIRGTGESYLRDVPSATPEGLRRAGRDAGISLALAGAVLASAAGVLLRARTAPGLAWLVVAAPILELTGFARSQWAHFSEAEVTAPELRRWLADHPGDARVQHLAGPNNGFLIGRSDIWGNDPGLLRRYAEFIAFSQGVNPDHADQNVDFRTPSPLFRLLRMRYLFTGGGAALRSHEFPNPLGRVQLVGGFRVVPDRDAAFAVMNDPSFDPLQTVLLESEPVPAPDPGGALGIVRLIADASESSDAFTVEARLASPALLLVTDPYSRDWHARPLAGSVQNSYEVLPADRILRATPLAAGLHRIRFEYQPSGLAAGILLSSLGWIAWCAAWFCARTLRRMPGPSEPGGGQPISDSGPRPAPSVKGSAV